MTIKTPPHHQRNYEFIGQFLILIGAVCLLVAPTIYGALSFLYSETKSRNLSETIIILGFGGLAIGFLISVIVSAKKQITKKRYRS